MGNQMKTEVREWAGTGSSPTLPDEVVVGGTFLRRNAQADKGGPGTNLEVWMQVVKTQGEEGISHYAIRQPLASYDC